jgi:hypothetical protein
VAERYYGVDIAEDGALVVAVRPGCGDAGPVRFPSGSAGVTALREHVAKASAHPHVCIRSRGAAALAIATALIALPGVEVTLVAPHAIASPARAGQPAAPATAEEGALRLARLAERLF